MDRIRKSQAQWNHVKIIKVHDLKINMVADTVGKNYKRHTGSSVEVVIHYGIKVYLLTMPLICGSGLPISASSH